MDWVKVQGLARDNAAEREFQSWFDAFETDAKRWSATYYGYHVTNRRYETVYGDVHYYTNKKFRNQ